MNKAFFIFLIGSNFVLQAQNLVVDGGFENTFHTESYGGIEDYTNSFLHNWFEVYSKNETTPYVKGKYAIDSVSQSNERFRVGNYYIEPHSGKSYTQLHYIHNNSIPSQFHAAMFVGKLVEPMQKGKLYDVSMFIAGERDVSMVSTGVGIAFASDTVGMSENEFARKISIATVSDEFVDSGNWQSVEGKYLSKGNEKFVVIGYLLPPNQRKYKILRYYFLTKDIAKLNKVVGWNVVKSHKFNTNFCVDDVLVSESATQFADDELEKLLPENETFLLRNIEFQTGKATLTESSIPYLNKLLDLLKNNPSKQIQITGHTDSTGEEKGNLLLSQARAKSVATYLQTNGINPAKIKVAGEGESQLLTDNNSEEGRRINRRVEIRFSE